MAQYQCTFCGETTFKGLDYCPGCGAYDSAEKVSKYRDTDEDPYGYAYADDDGDKKSDYDYPYP
jgi:predicted ATP-dependent serine protease